MINLSRKKKDSLDKRRSEKEDYDKFVSELDDFYFELYGEDYSRFYGYFLDLLEKRYMFFGEGNYNEFVKFVDKYSSHRDEFRDEKIRDYLDDESSEEELDEDSYDFLFKKGDRF